MGTKAHINEKQQRVIGVGYHWETDMLLMLPMSWCRHDDTKGTTCLCMQQMYMNPHAQRSKHISKVFMMWISICMMLKHCCIFEVQGVKRKARHFWRSLHR